MRSLTSRGIIVVFIIVCTHHHQIILPHILAMYDIELSKEFSLRGVQ